MTDWRGRRFLTASTVVIASQMLLSPVGTDALPAKRAGFGAILFAHEGNSRAIAVPAGGVADDGVILQDAVENRSLLQEHRAANVESPHAAPLKKHKSWPIFLPAMRHLRLWKRPSRDLAISPGTPVEHAEGIAGNTAITLTLGDKDLGSPGLRNLVLFGFTVLFLFCLRDWLKFYSLFRRDASAAELLMDASGNKQSVQTLDAKLMGDDGELAEWSTFSLICLTSYRFYTGFLSATWLPYLLAMEGADLYSKNQSLFMGLAKLVYGVTILANPLFGLIGDRAISLSHGVGRRLFLRAGMILAALGICGCFIADLHRYFYCFVFGILLWRIGDALTDVTTEALVPELLPNSQYKAASIAKATQFLLGSIFGFVTLIFMRDFKYTWLYWAYALGMLVFSIPSQVLLWDDSPLMNGHSSNRSSKPFLETLEQAYFAPAQLSGWFPRACLAITSFSFGTSPMFFLLLMLRDLVGSTNPDQLNIDFSTCSIIFFVSAAVAVLINGVLDGRYQAATSKSDGQDLQMLINRLSSVVCVSLGYAICCILLPGVTLFPSERVRYWLFAFFSLALGCFFGSGFARFQDITWQLIPNGADVANCMGFNIMCRLFGVGLGNFAAGVLLDLFEYSSSQQAWQRWQYERYGDDPGVMLVQVYAPAGYCVMCTGSAVVCLICGYLCHTITVGLKKEIAEAHAPVRAA